MKIFAIFIDAIMIINIKNLIAKFAINYVVILFNFKTKINNFVMNSINFKNFVFLLLYNRKLIF